MSKFVFELRFNPSRSNKIIKTRLQVTQRVALRNIDRTPFVLLAKARVLRSKRK